MKYYAGIGSRETPNDVRDMMENIGYAMAKHGWTLRSGGAGGADTAFELGAVAADGPREIYLPWSGFNGRVGDYPCIVSDEAMALAAQFHPAWDRCRDGARRLHARNGYQILGEDLKTPSSLVICWTPDGKAGGGTGQAIRIAKHHGILVHDLAFPNVRHYYQQRLDNFERSIDT